MIKAASGAVIRSDAVKASDELVAGLISPNPPSLAGRERSSRSVGEHFTSSKCRNEMLMYCFLQQ